MKTMVAGLVLMAAAGSVLASNYEEYGARVQACKDYADTADIYWRMEKQGKRPTPFDDKWMEPVRAHIEDEIYNNNGDYPDREAAARMGALYCMDHIVSLARNHNAGLN